MTRVSLTGLIDQLSDNYSEAGRMMEAWPSNKVGQIADAFHEMMLAAGVSRSEVEELSGSLRATLMHINASANGIVRDSGSAQHVIEKGRRAIRQALDEPATTGFRID